MLSQKLEQRAFVGIKVPDEFAEVLADFQGVLAGLPARPIGPKDMHLTLVPPWVMTDEDHTGKIITEALRGQYKFSIRFDRLSYGPTVRKPRLLWIESHPSSEFDVLKKVLETALGVKSEHPSFVPHVTIARFSEKDRALFVRRLVERTIDLPPMPVSSVELIASPHGGGTGYRVLRSFPLLDR